MHAMMEPNHQQAEPSVDLDAAPERSAGSPADAAAPAADAPGEAAAAEGEANPGFSGATPGGAIWQKLIADAPAAPAHPRNPSLPTFAALMTLILTFFIVLTSVSINDRKKTDAAMASVQDAFWGKSLPVPFQQLDVDTVRRDFILGITGRVQSLVPLMGGEQSTAAEDQILWLPLSLAFEGEATDLLPAFSPVLQELLSASRKIPAAFDYVVELRLCASAADDRLRRRAVALADGLTQLQAPLSRFAVGIQDCAPDRMAFAVALSPLAGPNP